MPMTKHELSQLYTLNSEIELHKARLAALEASLEHHKTHDVVQASSAHSPYTQHAQWIGGYPCGDETEGLQADIHTVREIITSLVRRCITEQARLERFIASVPDSEMRMILALRYINGLPWGQVAASIGSEGDGSTERKKVDRFLESFPVFPRK